MTFLRTSRNTNSFLLPCVAAGILFGAPRAYAEPSRAFDIAPQPLASALLEFSKQADQQVVGASDDIGAKWSSGVKGSFDNKEALERLLEGTHLAFVAVDQKTVRIYARVGNKAPAEGPSSPSSLPNRELSGNPGNKTATDGRAQAPFAKPTTSGGPALQGLGDVLVTAQKKSERLQDVPIPVTVLSQDVLEENNDVRLQDYFGMVPGLSLAPVGPGMQSLSLRGLTTSVVGNPTVGVAIDDMPYGSSTLLGFGAVVLPDLDPSDLAQIEVLRGPQGTLYGASSLGGLLKFETRDPTPGELSGRIQISGDRTGTGDAGYGVRAAVNVPLSETVAVRASGFTRRDPGFITNVTSGAKAVNSANVDGGRLAILWRPTEHFSVKLSALVQHTSGDGTGTVDSDASLQPAYGDLTQARQVKEGYDSKVHFFTGTVRARMGAVELAVLTAYSRNGFDSVSDETPSFTSAAETYFGVAGTHGVNRLEVTKISQEIRLGSLPDEHYEWLVGAFYTHENAKIDQVDAAVDLQSGQQAGVLDEDNYPTTLTERAVFADLTIHWTDQFSLQLGGRGSNNIQHYRETDTGPLVPYYFGGLPSPVIIDPQRTTGTAFTYLVTPQWRLSPDTMIYARITSGYRLGGNNIEAAIGQVPSSYKPDKTNNYELGIKGDALRGKLTYDVAAYYTNWKDIQIYLYSPITFSGYNENAGTAKTQGVELSIQARPGRGWSISGTATLIDAKLTEDFPGNAVFSAHAGDRLPFSARESGSLSVKREIVFGQSLTGFVGGSLLYQGSRLGEFGSAFGPSERLRFPAYVGVDVRAGVTSRNWSASLFANNLTDGRGIIGARANSYLLTNSVYNVRPRSVGIAVSCTF